MMAARLPLTDIDYVRAATSIRVHPAALMAVAEVEAPRGGFLPSGQPTVLFERHWFSKLTNHKYDVAHPEISSRTPGGYHGGEAEHARIQSAADLDRTAALMSTSWGKFQLMGFNYGACHMASLQDFINAIYRDEQSHLRLFVDFIGTKGLAKYLQTQNFDRFAYSYNGPNYRDNDYANKMRRYFTTYKMSMA